MSKRSAHSPTRRGGGCCSAAALQPNPIKMNVFPLHAAAYDERLTLTQHLSELRASLLVSLALYEASIARLRLDERKSARHALSG